MKRHISILIALFCFYPVYCAAQTVDFSEKDSISVSENLFLTADTVKIDLPVNNAIQLMPEKFKPNSKKSTIYAAIFPGLGQIYNRKYWKLPLVYGSFIGCAYAINWNGSQYNGYRQAYKDLVDNNPETDSWKDYRYGSYLREDPENWTEGMKRDFANSLKTVRDLHRRNRDLSYIVTVGVYAIWIVDAYVDAQLFDFDISPDISMRIEPVLFERTTNNSLSVGMQLCFAF